MKVTNRFLHKITLLLLTALLAAVPSANTYAEDAGESGNSGTSSTEGSPKKMYKTGVYRINDWGEVFKPEEKDQLDELVCEQMEECHLDFPIILKATGSKSSEEYTDTFYAHNGLGWGDGKDGVMLVLYTDKEEVFAKGYGFGHWFLNKELNQKICTKLSLMQKEKRSWSEIVTAYVNLIKERNQEIKESGKPAWYPKDLETFTDFHDPDAPRLVDLADIFTLEEEEQMLSIIKSIQKDSGKDIVVYTDVTTYGLSRRTFAADINELAGYGFGDDFSGTVLFICMEQGNRGWWTDATGECQEIYSEYVINVLDDALEPYMVGGKYGEGVIDYLKNVKNLYKVPEWYPADKAAFKPFHNESANRIADYANLFDDATKEKLQDAIKRIQDEYGMDMAIYTDSESYWRDEDTLAKEFYKYNGYGFGDDYTGSALFICTERGSSSFGLYEEGKCKEIYTDYEVNKMSEKLRRLISSESYGDAAREYLDMVYELYKFPDWYPSDSSNFVRFKAQNKKYVVDQTALFSEEEKAKLEQKALELSNKIGADVLIVTAENTIRGGSAEDFAKDFYRYNGYGQGDENDALIFCIIRDGYRMRWALVTGDAKRKCYSERNMDHMSEYIDDAMEDYDGHLATSRFMTDAWLMYRLGFTLPKLRLFWPILLGLILGLIVAGKYRKRLNRGMVTIQKAIDAEPYYEQNSFVLTDSSDVLINTTETRERIISNSTRSGGGSGRSSYSSGYHSSRGSSGRSHSGGGRSF
ncbi:MAG: TPM domain-containing protein [Treponema sp.]|nr:TPM domain-containing protein [Treponema sp.]